MRLWNDLLFLIRRSEILWTNLTCKEVKELKTTRCLQRSLTAQLRVLVAKKDLSTYKEWLWIIMFGTDFRSESKEKDCQNMELDFHIFCQTWETVLTMMHQGRVRWQHQSQMSKLTMIKFPEHTPVASQNIRKTKEVVLQSRRTPIALQTILSKVLMILSFTKMVILSLH